MLARRPFILASGLLALILISLVAITLGLAYRTRSQLIQSHTVTYTPPTEIQKEQVRRILIRREGKNGIEYLEILMDGTINLYDANMKLIKSGLQGYGRVNSILDDFAKNLSELSQLLGGRGRYTITIETNKGTYTYTTTGSGSNANLLDDLIKEIEELVDQTFTPTPTPAPTYTPPTAPTAPTSPSPTFATWPTPTIPYNALTPTPLPEYLTAPPFSCSDYDLSRPTAISNIICLPEP